MSGLVMPAPSEMPDEELDRVISLARVARAQLEGARERLGRVDQMIVRGVALGHRDSMAMRVLDGVRRHEVQLWQGEVDQLVARAREFGVEL